MFSAVFGIHVVFMHHISTPSGLLNSEIVVAIVVVVIFAMRSSLFFSLFSLLFENACAIDMMPPVPAAPIAKFLIYFPIEFNCIEFGISRRNAVFRCCDRAMSIPSMFNADAACLCKLAVSRIIDGELAVLSVGDDADR